MIAKFLFLLLFIQSVSALAQEPKSKFYRTADKYIDFESEIFELRSNNQFNYIFFTCTGIGIGKGTYSILGDSLHLEFEEFPNSNAYPHVNFTTDERDSVQLNLQVLDDKSEETLPGVTCFFLRSNIGWASDSSGKIKGNTLKADTARVLEISLVGFKSASVEIPPQVSEINGIIKLGNYWYFRPTDSKSVKLISLENSQLKLSKHDQSAITYRRTNKKLE